MAPNKPAYRMSEADWQRRVVDTALRTGWMCHHVPPIEAARGGWFTPEQGHTGFPDWVFARDGVVLICELKSETGVVEQNQKPWLQHLGDHVQVWRPRDWDTLVYPALTAPRRRRVS